MATSIEVQKQSVKQLLETGKAKKFVVPEYQRPYAWTEDEIKTLFDDLTEFTASDKDESYFLGAIVSYENENREQEIIDGQQRLTSLFLLLRAIYHKLISMTETKEVKNFKGKIEAALWEQDELTAEVNYEKTLILSKVMGDEGNKVFADILTKGVAEPSAKDNYSINYRLFIDLIEQYATNEPELFFWFIRNILDKAILLPITADNQDTALTIFSTLNDRGLALSDADIFKAKIYNHLDDEGKEEFIKKWQRLDSDATDSGESIQKLFYYYMFYLRALENDIKTTTPGIRKYYSRNKFEQLYRTDVMEDLASMLNLWIVVNNRTEIVCKEWSKNTEIKKSLCTLSSYPNEFWKYPVVIYYLKYSDFDNFEELFEKFLKKLIAVLLVRYIITPTINAVKGGILKLNAEIINTPNPKFDFGEINNQELKDKIKTTSKTVRMILKILAYRYQDELLPEQWEIEHILPQKWQNHYFPNTPDEEVKELVEHIGNKIPFEKKLNIQASNGYFAKKQESYKESKVQIVLDMSEQHSDWGMDEIRERDIRIYDELMQILYEWQVADPEQEKTPVPTAEEQILIDNLKKRGLI